MRPFEAFLYKDTVSLVFIVMLHLLPILQSARVLERFNAPAMARVRPKPIDATATTDGPPRETVLKGLVRMAYRGLIIPNRIMWLILIILNALIWESAIARLANAIAARDSSAELAR